MITLQLLQQIIVFFLMMACGYAVVKCGLIDAKSSKTLSVICIYIIMPCVMINAFQIEYSRSIRNGFLLAVAASCPDPYFSAGICQDHRQTAEIKRGGKRIHHLFQFRKSGDPTCNRSPW